MDGTSLVVAMRTRRSQAEIEEIAHICSVTSRTYDRVRTPCLSSSPLHEVFRSRSSCYSKAADAVPYLVGASAHFDRLHGPGGRHGPHPGTFTGNWVDRSNVHDENVVVRNDEAEHLSGGDLAGNSCHRLTCTTETRGSRNPATPCQVSGNRGSDPCRGPCGGSRLGPIDVRVDQLRYECRRRCVDVLEQTDTAGLAAGG